MKDKIKRILLLFSFAGTFFVSCTTEEDVVRNESYKSKFQVREQSYQELIRVNSFKRALDKIPKQKKTITTLNGKTVMEGQYGFSIIDTPIKITETDETIAYNLLVKSDTITEGNYFENLLINIDKQTNLVKAYLVKYNLEDTNLLYTNHDSFLFNGTRSAREIIYNNSPVRTFGKESAGPCITYQILMCSYQGNHVAGEQCILNNFDLLYVQTQTSGDCSTGVDPIDTSGGIGGTTSSGGTTSNCNTNDGSTTVIDNPTPSCDTCIELTSELSDFLADLSNEQLDYWNNLEYVNKRSIVSYLVQNNYSIESMLFAEDLIDDMLNFPNPEGEDNGDEFNYNDYSDIQTTTQTLPGRNLFYSHFPKVGTNGMPSPQVYQLVGGHPYQAHLAGNPNYQNACALRISRALNYSGNIIPIFKNNNNEQKTERGDDNLNYILDASSLLAYMKKTFPNNTPIHLVNKTPAEIKKALNGKWGIYIMIPKNRATFGASGHADFWSNTGCLSGCYFDKAKEVYFWELF